MKVFIVNKNNNIFFCQIKLKKLSGDDINPDRVGVIA
jgi:hypothetical protein